MAIYSFKNNETGEIFELTMPMIDREKYLEENPHITQIITKINIGDPIGLGIQKSTAMTERLKHIKKNYKGSTIDI